MNKRLAKKRRKAQEISGHTGQGRSGHGDRKLPVPARKKQKTTKDTVSHDSSIGTHDSSIGTRDSSIGTRDSSIGTHDSSIGTHDSSIGTHDSSIGSHTEIITVSLAGPQAPRGGGEPFEALVEQLHKHFNAGILATLNLAAQKRFKTYYGSHPRRKPVVERLISNFMSRRQQKPRWQFPNETNMFFLREMRSTEFQRTIYLFGENHAHPINCSKKNYDGTHTIQTYITNLISTTDAFLDIFNEYHMSHVSEAGIEYRSGLSELEPMHKAISDQLEKEKREKKAPLVRYHQTDIRRQEHFPLLFDWKETLGVQRYRFYGEPTMEAYIMDFSNDKWNITLTLCRMLFLGGVLSRASEQTLVRLVQSMLERVSGGGNAKKCCWVDGTDLEGVREILDVILRRMWTEIYAYISKKVGGDEDNVRSFLMRLETFLFEMIEQKQPVMVNGNELHKAFYHICSYLILRVRSTVMDFYTIYRMFKQFAVAPDKPDKCHQIVYFAGSAHCRHIAGFLEMLGFETVSQIDLSGKTDETACPRRCGRRLLPGEQEYPECKNWFEDTSYLR